MKSPSTKSSDELNKEVRSQLGKVRRDVEEIESRLTPGQLIDDAIFYPHGENLAGTFEHLKRNPIGTAFLSLGTILLMEDSHHQTYEHVLREQITNERKETREKLHELGAALEAKLSKLESKFTSVSVSEPLKERITQLGPGTMIALAAGLGVLTGIGFPVSEKEANYVQQQLGKELSELRADLESALDESANLLKELLLQQAQDYDFRLSRRS